MKQIFVDSFYLLALFNERDSAHEQAVAVSKELEGLLVTTDWVLTEVADALCGTLNRTGCVEFLEDLRNSSRVELSLHRAVHWTLVGLCIANGRTKTGHSRTVSRSR